MIMGNPGLVQPAEQAGARKQRGEDIGPPPTPTAKPEAVQAANSSVVLPNPLPHCSGNSSELHKMNSSTERKVFKEKVSQRKHLTENFVTDEDLSDEDLSDEDLSDEDLSDEDLSDENLSDEKTEANRRRRSTESNRSWSSMTAVYGSQTSIDLEFIQCFL
ncbi:hypothetical protein GQ43DRAFT_460831 [Delitschia confertaspora ATCC 74209]|uniref:Uncharacterized protein n=1 Tax=Delitschia confertaspora ATCC 74209 TaxID=1513339 RepID=A0A9P4JS70_9PLEO|nr:hypothetical protein GQ43DRAFT_460831 [Delitschia confertaspora ATCC 74209]